LRNKNADNPELRELFEGVPSNVWQAFKGESRGATRIPAKPHAIFNSDNAAPILIYPSAVQRRAEGMRLTIGWSISCAYGNSAG
jgi:hypothetical protein